MSKSISFFKATERDKEVVLEVLSESFKDNFSVNWMVKNDHKKPWRFKKLLEYSFNYAIQRNAIYISEDHTAVGIWFKNTDLKMTFKDLWLQLKFVFQVCGIERTPMILKQQKMVKQIKDTDVNGKGYLYFWYLGAIANKQSVASVKCLKDEIFRQSKVWNLPIYAETSSTRNVPLYTRYGMEMYDKWSPENDDFDYWFFKREVNAGTRKEPIYV